MFLSLNRFDRTLGGLEMELRLREHLAKLFNEQRKGQKAKDVRENPRAMAKLLREANRLKTVLSANADHMAQVTTWDLVESRLVAPVLPLSCPVLLKSIFFCPESRPDQSLLLLFPQIEGLMDDVDFKAKVTRVEFEELCADLFDRVPGPVQQALQSAEMSLVRDEGDRAEHTHRVSEGKGVNSCTSPSPSAGSN